MLAEIITLRAIALKHGYKTTFNSGYLVAEIITLRAIALKQDNNDTLHNVPDKQRS